MSRRNDDKKVEAQRQRKLSTREKRYRRSVSVAARLRQKLSQQKTAGTRSKEKAAVPSPLQRLREDRRSPDKSSEGSAFSAPVGGRNSVATSPLKARPRSAFLRPRRFTISKARLEKLRRLRSSSVLRTITPEIDRAAAETDEVRELKEKVALLEAKLIENQRAIKEREEEAEAKRAQEEQERVVRAAEAMRMLKTKTSHACVPAVFGREEAMIAADIESAEKIEPVKPNPKLGIGAWSEGMTGAISGEGELFSGLSGEDGEGSSEEGRERKQEENPQAYASWRESQDAWVKMVRQFRKEERRKLPRNPGPLCADSDEDSRDSAGSAGSSRDKRSVKRKSRKKARTSRSARRRRRKLKREAATLNSLTEEERLMLQLHRALQKGREAVNEAGEIEVAVKETGQRDTTGSESEKEEQMLEKALEFEKRVRKEREEEKQLREQAEMAAALAEKGQLEAAFRDAVASLVAQHKADFKAKEAGSDTRAPEAPPKGEGDGDSADIPRPPSTPQQSRPEDEGRGKAAGRITPSTVGEDNRDATPSHGDDSDAAFQAEMLKAVRRAQKMRKEWAARKRDRMSESKLGGSGVSEDVGGKLEEWLDKLAAGLPFTTEGGEKSPSSTGAHSKDRRYKEGSASDGGKGKSARVVDGPGVRAGRPMMEEPPVEAPAMEASVAGFAAMLMAGKGGRKQPTMKILRVLSKKRLLEFRDERQKYLLAVDRWNRGSPIKMTAAPVSDFVDVKLWDVVSLKKLRPEQRTELGQPANHVKCTEYFLDVGDYASDEFRVPY